jgi:hypothetical protein
MVAERGFGNERIINLLEELDFDYVLRLNENLKFKKSDVEPNVKALPHKNFNIPHAFGVKWNREITLVKRVQEDESWILATSQPFKSSSKTGQIYEQPRRCLKTTKAAVFTSKNFKLRNMICLRDYFLFLVLLTLS